MLAVSSMASLYFNMKDFDEAEKWHRKTYRSGAHRHGAARSAGPPRSYYHHRRDQLDAVVRASPSRRARSSGMKPEDPGPIQDEEKRQELVEKACGPRHRRGNRGAEQGGRDQPRLRRRHGLHQPAVPRARPTWHGLPSEEYEQLLAQGRRLGRQKTMDTRKRLAEESTAGYVPRRRVVALAGGRLFRKRRIMSPESRRIPRSVSGLSLFFFGTAV